MTRDLVAPSAVVTWSDETERKQHKLHLKNKWQKGLPSGRFGNLPDLCASSRTRIRSSDRRVLCSCPKNKYRTEQEVSNLWRPLLAVILNTVLDALNIPKLTIFVVVLDKILPIRNWRGVFPRCGA
jgi:hypothetical protein